MRRRIVAAALISFALPLFALADDRVSPTVNILIGGLSVYSSGTVEYSCGNLFASCWMDGYHNITDGGTGTAVANSAIPANEVNALDTRTVYTGTITSGTIYSHCYQANLSGTGHPGGGLPGDNQRVSSSTACAPPQPPLPPPPPPAVDFCGTGCEDPLVLDLNGDGVQTTGTGDPVLFDMDGDGVRELITWTNPNTAEGFLFLDLDHKGRVENGSEIFGVGTVMPDGSRGHNGFEALAVYDMTANGGNADGILDSDDAIWNRLRIWVDANHDGVCAPNETGTMHSYGVGSIQLGAVVTNAVDAAGNVHQLQSYYLKRGGGRPGDRQRSYSIDGVAFKRVQ